MLFGLDGIELSLIIVFTCLLLGILSGYPVAFSLGGSSLIAFAIIVTLNANGLLLTETGEPIFKAGSEWRTFTRYNGFIGSRIFSNIFGGPSVDVLLAVPLFVFMGITLERSRIAEDLLTTMAKMFGPMPGGLAISVVIVGALLAASTGIVGATVVTMGLLSLPTMLNKGYQPELATGTICASGTLGQIIPPSIVLVLLGQQVGEYYSQAHPGSVVSVGTLFKAAMLPGLLLVALYIAYILIIALLSPNKAPAVYDTSKKRNYAISHFGGLRNFSIVLFGLPLIFITAWILGNRLGLIGPQTSSPGYLSDAFKAAPISQGIAAFIILCGIIMSLRYALYPQKKRLPLAVGGIALILVITAAIWLVFPETAPGTALLYYAIPTIMLLWALRICAADLWHNEVIRVVFPPIILIIAVLGSILGGVTNPTAAAGLGAAGAIMLAATKQLKPGQPGWPITWASFSIVILLLISNNFDIRILEGMNATNFIAYVTALGLFHVAFAGLLYCVWVLLRAKSTKSGNSVMQDVCRETTKITSMVFLILIGSQMLNLTLKTFGGDTYVQDLLQQFNSDYQVLLLVMAVIFVLGFVLDFLEIIYIVLPIVGPVLFGGDLDPRWVTILIAVNLQTSFLTPPFGFALFYLRGVAPNSVSTLQIYRGIVPFVMIQVLALLILWFAEPITTFLPNLLPEGG